MGLFKLLKILLNKILLSPLRENIKCPKALPRFRGNYKPGVAARPELPGEEDGSLPHQSETYPAGSNVPHGHGWVLVAEFIRPKKFTLSVL